MLSAGLVCLLLLILPGECLPHSWERGPIPQDILSHKDDYQYLRASASRLHLYYKLDSTAQELIVKLLCSEVEADYSAALLVVEHCGGVDNPNLNKKLFNRLIVLSRAKNPAIRVTATWALGRIDTYGAIPRLIMKLADRDGKVREAAAISLFNFLERRKARLGSQKGHGRT